MDLKEVKDIINNKEFREVVFKFKDENIYVSRSKIVNSLDLCLQSINEELLDSIFVVYKVFYKLKEVKTRKEKELVLKDKITEAFVDFLNTLNKNDNLALEDLVKNGKTKIENIPLISNGFVFAFYENDEIVYIMPNELIEIYKKTYTKEFKQEKDLERVDKLIRLYTLINGLVEKEFFYDVIKNYYKIDLTKKEIDEIVKKAGITVYKKKYYCMKFPDMEIYDYLLEEYDDLTCHILSEEQIENYFYFYSHAISGLGDILKDNKLAMVIITMFATSSYNDETIIDDYIENKKISKKKLEEARKFINDISSSIRFWDLKGRTEMEFDRKITIDEFLISKKPLKTDLKSCLKSLSDDAYNDIYYNYFDDDNHLIDELANKIIELFNEIIDEGLSCAGCLLERHEQELDYGIEDEDIESGYAFIYKDKDVVKVFFPDELLEILKNNNRHLDEFDEEFDDEFGNIFDNFFTDLISAYLQQNGIIKREKLQELLKENDGIDLSLEDLDDEILKLDMHIKEGYYTAISDMNKEDIKELENTKNKFSKYKKVDFEVIGNEDKLYNELENLNQKIGLTKNKLEELYSIIITCIKEVQFSEEVFHMFIEEYNFDINKKQEKEIVSIIKKYKNDISIWAYNGYTVNEYIELNKKVKIGRNDLCSCGSGKKYKKCCGK